MEKRLIDAKNAISILKILSDKCCDDKSFEQAISVLESVPTIDAVPVVRCKECKHSKDGVGGRLKCMFHNEWHKPDWFCADGEVKNNG